MAASNGTSPVECVLFDLDGTVADTAPDLAYALNLLRAERGLDAVPVSTLRSKKQVLIFMQHRLRFSAR